MFSLLLATMKGKTLGEVVNELIQVKDGQSVKVEKNKEGLYKVEVLNQNDTQNINEFVTLILRPGDSEYGIIGLDSDSRGFFPNYQEQMILETDIKPFVVHPTSGAERDGIVKPGYLSHPRTNQIEEQLLNIVPDANTPEGSLVRFYEGHPELGAGSQLVISKVEDKHYRIINLEK
jgi:hypothetical protein